MKEIKKGDIVVRKSHGKDIIFYVKTIIKTNQGKIAILCGMIERIEADSRIEDLELVNKKILNKSIRQIEQKFENRLQNRGYRIGIITPKNKTIQPQIVTGKILHLDGDRRYSQKSYNYYRKLGLNAIVKNVPEYKQPKVVYSLLKTYKPDIIIITGHDRNDKKRNKL